MQLSDRAPDSKTGLKTGDFRRGLTLRGGPGARKIDHPPGVTIKKNA